MKKKDRILLKGSAAIPKTAENPLPIEIAAGETAKISAVWLESSEQLIQPQKDQRQIGG